MRILVTNDDGVLAPGLEVAERIAADIAGPDGEVWVVAPESERSGVGHCVSYAKSVRVNQLGPRRFAVDGYPADCALIGVRKLMGAAPDLVLSGVNAGHNIAEDVVYSGTVGAAMEAALQGIRAIALSQYYRATEKRDYFASARANGAEAVRRVLNCPWERDVFYNVNFPPDAAPEGIVLAAEGRRPGAQFDCVEADAPNRRRYFWLSHKAANTSAGPNADATLCAQGWITVTPMRPRLAAEDLFDAAAAALEREPA